MQHVFTYGSLMFEPVWRRVVLGHYLSEVASIRGFRRLSVREKEHPALVISRQGDEILGRVYLDVRHSDIERLDAFETERYARVTITATAESDHRLVLAQTYLALNVDELRNVSRFEREGLPRFMAGYVAQHAPNT
jgi:gamma-glutamylcyclotransferase (GGCT)/AIG2-like uncharacterized protein YtfP